MSTFYSSYHLHPLHGPIGSHYVPCCPRHCYRGSRPKIYNFCLSCIVIVTVAVTFTITKNNVIAGVYFVQLLSKISTLATVDLTYSTQAIVLFIQGWWSFVPNMEVVSMV